MSLDRWDYDRWQKELDTVLIRGRSAKEPVVLFVNRELLHQNFPFFDSPVESLAQAVAENLRSASTRHVFNPIRQRLDRWQEAALGGTPPVLPLIALTVMAAADMGSDDKGGPLMYYGRLQEILGQPFNATQLANSYDDVAYIWRALHRWIGDQEWLGTSTILEDDHFSRIGYARSQAVMSKQDALNLTDFFYKLGSTKLNMLKEAQLLDELARWNRKYKRLSRAMSRSLEGDTKGSARAVLASVLSILVRNWDGKAKVHHAQSTFYVQMRLDLDEWKSRWVVARRHGIDHFEAVDSGGSRVRLSASGVGNFYTSSGLPESVPESIDISRTWSNGEGRVLLRPRKVWIFALDPVSGDWVSTHGADPYQEMVLLVRDDQAEALATLLDDVGVQGYKRIGGPRQIVRGWDLFIRVVISDYSSDTRLGDWIGLGQASAEEPAERPRLVNGLRIRTHSGVNVYLAGGEPDLVVPATPFGAYSLSLDDSPETELRANGSALPLHKLLSGHAGYHILLVNDSDILEFETVSPDDYNLSSRVGDCLESSQEEDLPTLAPCQDRKVFSRSADYLIVHKLGTITDVTAPVTPHWLERAGYANGSRFDYIIPPDGIWLITLRRGIVRSVEKLHHEDIEVRHRVAESSSRKWKMLLEDKGLASRNAEWLNVLYQARQTLRL